MILVTGANGQLGFDVVKELKKRNIEYKGTCKSDLDIVNFEEVSKYISRIRPDCVIHCAAYTTVDKAEDEREECYKVNVVGTENVAKACKNVDCKMIYISTDYVFDGKSDKPYEINDIANPLSFYGKSKYEGEMKVKGILNKYFIIRTSWVFGVEGKNFVKTMIRLGKEQKNVDVVCDQIGSPTYTKDLAMLLCDMANSNRYGLYHATNEGYCSWAEFATEIMKKSNINCKINSIHSSGYRTKATRPLKSTLSKRSLVENRFNLLPEWKEALKRYLREIEEK